MNIIDYSIKLGKSLNKTDLGKEIKKIYFSLVNEFDKREEKAKIFYQLYNQCVEHECSKNHFYGWTITYKNMEQYIKAVLKDEKSSIMDTAEYVLQNIEFKKMSEVSEKMGNLVVALCHSIICSSYNDKNIKELLKITKVRNAVIDLQMAVERSGLKAFLFKNANIISKNDGYEQELRNNNYIPYVNDHSSELCINEENKIVIEAEDRLLFVEFIILRGIFEGFWDILIELSSDDIVEKDFEQPSVIHRGTFKHKAIVKELLNKDAWIYKVYDDGNGCYFLANKRILQIENNQSESEVYGVAYPDVDIGLFEKENIIESIN